MTDLSTPQSTSLEVSEPKHNHKLYVETVGCQMNELDSELVVAALRQQGYELTPTVKDADTVIFNTCSVREHAEHKVYSALGRLKYARRRRPNQVISVIGCMAQKDQELIFQRAPHVDVVVGTGQLSEIPKLISEARTNRKPLTALSLDRRDGTKEQVSGSFQSYDPLRDPEMRPSPFQAYVRIMIGCDKFCTYCVVPSTRGPEQSRAPRDILREVQVLADQGVKEVTLLGQTVNSYRHTQDGREYTLADLLELIHDTDGIDRIRFVTNYPKDMGRELLQAVRDLPKVVRYLHVPAQSGCNEILKRMKRGYTVEDYREMMHRINEIVPGCSISSDFIVGFCGETEESFELSMDLIRECRFKNSFIFKYSARTGTKADNLYDDDISESVKKRRNNVMLALQNQISEEDNVEFIGRDVEVLVEGPSKNEIKRQQAESAATNNLAPESPAVVELDVAGSEAPETQGDAPPASPIQLMGRTDCDRIVVFDGNPRLAGSLTSIEVHDCTATTLIGSIVTRNVTHGMVQSLPVLSGS